MKYAEFINEAEEHNYLVTFYVTKNDDDIDFEWEVKATSPDDAIDRVKSGRVKGPYGQTLPKNARKFHAKLVKPVKDKRITESHVDDMACSAVMDTIETDFDPRTPEYDLMVNAVQEAFNKGEIDTMDFSHDDSAPYRVMREIADELGL